MITKTQQIILSVVADVAAPVSLYEICTLVTERNPGLSGSVVSNLVRELIDLGELLPADRRVIGEFYQVRNAEAA